MWRLVLVIIRTHTHTQCHECVPSGAVDKTVRWSVEHLLPDTIKLGSYRHTNVLAADVRWRWLYCFLVLCAHLSAPFLFFFFGKSDGVLICSCCLCFEANASTSNFRFHSHCEDTLKEWDSPALWMEDIWGQMEADSLLIFVPNHFDPSVDMLGQIHRQDTTRRRLLRLFLSVSVGEALSSITSSSFP